MTKTIKPTNVPEAPDPETILYSEVKLEEHLNETEARLRDTGQGVYQQQDKLVQVIRHNPVLPINVAAQLDDDFNLVPTPRPMRQAGALTITEISPHRLRELIGRVGPWRKFDERKGGWVPWLPTLPFAAHLIGRKQWKLNVLTGIAECPTMRADGSILETDGFDPYTGVYLDMNGVEYPKVKTEPTKNDALVALAVLRDLVKDFPFVPDEGGDGKSSAARSVAYSGYLTGVVRKALENAPAHAVDAAAAGTGKTVLCDSISIVATGRPASTLSQGPTVEEFDKRVHSALRSGDPVIMVDNVDRELESAQFCSALTSQVVKWRVLGESRDEFVNTQSLFLINGNNLRVKGDLADRTIMSKLDANMEDPGTRHFDRNILQYTLENRPQLVHACLTILRAYVAAGQPGWKALRPSRAPAWDAMVRGAIVWLGEPDPEKTREYVRTVDPERDAQTNVLQLWNDLIGVGVRVTASEVLEIADGKGDDFGTQEARDKAANFQEALGGILLGRAMLSAKSLGRALARFDRRVIGGLRIRMFPNSKSQALYCVERVVPVADREDNGDF